jgi:putative transposase
VGAVPSIGTVGTSYDNALAETTNGIYKTECHRNQALLATHCGHWKGLDDLELETARWVTWFNEERIHTALDDRSPAEVEADHYASQSQAQAA